MQVVGSLLPPSKKIHIFYTLASIVLLLLRRSKVHLLSGCVFLCLTLIIMNIQLRLKVNVKQKFRNIGSFWRDTASLIHEWDDFFFYFILLLLYYYYCCRFAKHLSDGTKTTCWLRWKSEPFVLLLIVEFQNKVKQHRESG